MKNLPKYFICGLFAFALNSCSIVLGGFAAIDNAAYKGQNEITQEKVKKLKGGEKMILTLNDSTKITGYYEGYEDGELMKTIILLDEKNNVRHIERDKVKKYIYFDDGTNIWIAAGVGAVIDASIIVLVFSKKRQSFGNIRVF